jgi:hypothetical protein
MGESILNSMRDGPITNCMRSWHDNRIGHITLRDGFVEIEGMQLGLSPWDIIRPSRMTVDLDR